MEKITSSPNNMGIPVLNMVVTALTFLASGQIGPIKNQVARKATDTKARIVGFMKSQIRITVGSRIKSQKARI